MPQAERIKETLGCPRLSSAHWSPLMCLWLAQNFRTTEAIMVVLAVVAVAGTTTGIVGVNYAAFRLIAQLENL